jgi:hypothetical protein
MPHMTFSQETEELVVIHEKITDLKNTALFLQARTADFPALHQNTKRILASVKMLELNLSDVLAMDPDAS